MMKSGDSYFANLDENVFGIPRILQILPEDVTALLKFQWIGQSIIAAYMTTLHEIISEKDELRLYAFVDPGATYNPTRPEFVPYMLDRLKKSKSDLTIYFVPYNPGKHWILSIIWNGEIFVLDPLPSLIRYCEWENVLINVVKTCNAENGIATKLKQVKNLAPGGHECGYYVMRFMRDIIHDDTLSLVTKWAAKSWKSYSTEELDKVRYETADYIQSLSCTLEC